MFKSVLVLVAAASASSIAIAQSPAASDWTLEVAPHGCVVHAASPSGTVVSIWGFAGEDSLSFLVQNKSWNSFDDGARYDIKVAFDDKRAWPMQAVARRNIDHDGPGLTFAVSPAEDGGGASFLNQFAAAHGMLITRNNQVERVALGNSQLALTGLAKCLKQVWAANAPAAGESDAREEIVTASAAETI